MSSELTLSQARKLLQSYSCAETKPLTSETEKEELQRALQHLTQASDWENLGICASNLEEGFVALSSYLKALGYTPPQEMNSPLPSDEPVYIKFNTQKMSYFTDKYIGEYRGVLVSCQSEEDEIAGTYGYFPLDLFA